MCRKRLFTRNLDYNCKRYASTNFIRTCLDEVQASKKHSGTRSYPTRLPSGEDKNFELHISQKNWRILKIFFKLVTSYGRPFDLPWHSNKTRRGLTWLSFVGIHVFLLSFSMLTYPNEEEVGLLDLEASTRNILNNNSWITFEIWPV